MIEKLLELGLEQEMAESVEALYAPVIGQKDDELALLKKNSEAELERIKLENAVDIALLQAGGKNMRVLKALINKEEISVSEGVVSGLEQQINQLKNDSETGFLFESTPRLMGVSIAGEGADFKDEHLSYEQLCAYMESNSDSI